jgi:16S rRNA (guanine527-N7)-methyltransferase
MNKQEWKHFSFWMQKLGIEFDEAVLKRLEAYLDELCLWNEHMNLVGPSSRDRIVRELLLDALLAVPLLPDRGKLLDVGSGAGFPALPLKMAGSKMAFFLVEPIQKRVHFLKHVIRTVGLEGISVTRGRIESLAGRVDSAGYDVVTSRAMAPFERTIQMCAAYVAHGGVLLTFHGQSPQKILNEHATAAKTEGLEIESVIPYQLPGVAGLRHLAVLRKKT